MSRYSQALDCWTLYFAEAALNAELPPSLFTAKAAAWCVSELVVDAELKLELSLCVGHTTDSTEATDSVGWKIGEVGIAAAKDVTVEDIEGIGTKLDVDAFGDLRTLGEAEGFIQEGRRSYSTKDARRVAIGVGSCGCDVGVWILEGCAIVDCVDGGFRIVVARRMKVGISNDVVARAGIGAGDWAGARELLVKAAEVVA
jgi:hypothetical protein